MGAQTKATLVLSHLAATPGSTIQGGLKMEINEGWHIYWTNPGEAGIPPSVQWEVPEGIEIGELEWPLPEKVESLGAISYTYSHEVVIPFKLSLASDLAAGDYRLSGAVSWLECEKVCVPAQAKVEINLQVGPTATTSKEAGLIDKFLKRTPKQQGQALALEGTWGRIVDDGEREFDLMIGSAEIPGEVDFYPYPHDDYDVLGPTEKVDSKTLRKAVFKYEDDAPWPSELKGIVVFGSKEASRRLREVTFSLRDLGRAEVATEKEVQGPDKREDREDREGGAVGIGGVRSQSLWKMLMLALLGGLILNIMPCVLPVISLKVMSLVRQSTEAPGRAKQLGLLYGVGVLASFWVLAGLAISVQMAGGSASWGMIFQNPIARVLITLVMTLVALNLFGLFEVSLGGKAMNAAGALASHEGPAGAFMNGVLATVLATPCTAPFLSTALVFAFAQPPLVTVLIFSAVGVGLALPFVILCFKPNWLRFLPKPGPWMESFKTAMGFPMLAAAVWAFSFTIKGLGPEWPLWFGIFLVLVGLGVWTYGEFVQRGRRYKVAGGLVSAIILGLAFVGILESKLEWRNPFIPPQGQGIVQYGREGIQWHAWSEESVEEARRAGKTVLVDFTASWCATCQSNKSLAIEVDETRGLLSELDVQCFIGDFSNFDARIPPVLTAYGRPGVPLVLVYPADLSLDPIVLPELLTKSMVRNALLKATERDST